MPQDRNERERRAMLLNQLQERLAYVATENLLCPPRGTRPWVGLVVHYAKMWQFVFTDFSLGALASRILALLVLSLSLILGPLG